MVNIVWGGLLRQLQKLCYCAFQLSLERTNLNFIPNSVFLSCLGISLFCFVVSVFCFSVSLFSTAATGYFGDCMLSKKKTSKNVEDI